MAGSEGRIPAHGTALPQLSLHSPLGDLTVSEQDGAIVSLDWGWGRDQTENALLVEARAQLQDYFDGHRTRFELKLAPHGSPYRQRVWQALCRIPPGETRSYGEIARDAGGSPRSVGQANGSNPIPILIPCHRVTASSGIGGYSGGDGLVTKRWLLALEQRSCPDTHAVPAVRQGHAFAFRAATERSMTKAIRIHAHGGPEVLLWESVPKPEPGPGEVLIHHEAVGLNFIDVYFRTGLYKAPTMPATPGMEGAGTVTGGGRRGYHAQRRATAWPMPSGPIGAYATERVIAADRLVKLPDAIDFTDRRSDDAARADGAVPAPPHLSGAARRHHPGACGCRRRWADHVPMGEASRRHRDRQWCPRPRRPNSRKASMARRMWSSAPADLPAEVKRITGGAMVPVVYDSIGKRHLHGQPGLPGAARA